MGGEVDVPGGDELEEVPAGDLSDLPEDAAGALMRAVAAFVRATPATELPKQLRPVTRLTHDRGLARHRAALLGALLDEPMRARLGRWLDDEPGLRKSDAELLRLAVERPEGWASELRRRSGPPRRRRERDPSALVGVLEERLATERERTRRARADLSAARGEIRRLERERAAEARRQERRIGELEGELERSRILAEQARAEAVKSRSESERERRRYRRAARDAEREAGSLRDRAKQLAAENRTLKAQVDELTGQIRRMQTARRRSGRGKASSVGEGAVAGAHPLAVPKGLLPEAPETLEAWLGTPGVAVVVDGYNVTKAEGGFGDLPLEQQRRRLQDALARLARRRRFKATIVFDGSEVPPGASRRARGPVQVEYSAPGRSADDHIVSRLKGSPGPAVVVVTNDRELQARAAELGATIATSNQLLALLR